MIEHHQVRRDDSGRISGLEAAWWGGKEPASLWRMDVQCVLHHSQKFHGFTYAVERDFMILWVSRETYEVSAQTQLEDATRSALMVDRVRWALGEFGFPTSFPLFRKPESSLAVPPPFERRILVVDHHPNVPEMMRRRVERPGDPPGSGDHVVVLRDELEAWKEARRRAGAGELPIDPEEAQLLQALGEPLPFAWPGPELERWAEERLASSEGSPRRDDLGR